MRFLTKSKNYAVNCIFQILNDAIHNIQTKRKLEFPYCYSNLDSYSLVQWLVGKTAPAFFSLDPKTQCRVLFLNMPSRSDTISC